LAAAIFPSAVYENEGNFGFTRGNFYPFLLRKNQDVHKPALRNLGAEPAIHRRAGVTPASGSRPDKSMIAAMPARGVDDKAEKV